MRGRGDESVKGDVNPWCVISCVPWQAIVALGGINSGVGDALSAEVATVIFSGSSWVSAEDSEVPEVSSSSLDRRASFSCAGGCATIHHWPVIAIDVYCGTVLVH